MSSWISVRPPAQLPTASSVLTGIPVAATSAADCNGARSSQPTGSGRPLGADSVAKSMIARPPTQLCVVMPISLT